MSQQADRPWVDSIRYLHGQGAPPRAWRLSPVFATALFLLALLTALALLDQFA